MCCIYSRGSLQYSQSEEEGLMSQSQSIREAIKCPDESTGHSLCLVLSFTLSPKNSFPLSSTIPPSHSLPSIFHTPRRLVLMRILAMAVNTDPFSDPFGSKEVEVGRDSLFALFFLDLPAARASAARE